MASFMIAARGYEDPGPWRRQAPLQGVIPQVDSSEAPPAHPSLLILALVLAVTSQLFLLIMPGFGHVRG